MYFWICACHSHTHTTSRFYVLHFFFSMHFILRRIGGREVWAFRSLLLLHFIINWRNPLCVPKEHRMSRYVPLDVKFDGFFRLLSNLNPIYMSYCARAAHFGFLPISRLLHRSVRSNPIHTNRQNTLHTLLKTPFEHVV